MAGLELSTAKKRELAAVSATTMIACACCGTRVPKIVLRQGHGNLRWCGTVVFDDAGLVLCPACAAELGSG